MATNYFLNSYAGNFQPTIIVGGTSEEYPSNHFMIPVYQPTILGDQRIGFFVRYDLFTVVATGQPTENVVAPTFVGEGQGFFANYTGNFPAAIAVGGVSRDFPRHHVILPVYRPVVDGNHQTGFITTYSLSEVIASAHSHVRFDASNWVPPAGNEAQEDYQRPW